MLALYYTIMKALYGTFLGTVWQHYLGVLWQNCSFLTIQKDKIIQHIGSGRPSSIKQHFLRLSAIIKGSNPGNNLIIMASDGSIGEVSPADRLSMSQSLYRIHLTHGFIHSHFCLQTGFTSV